MNRPFLLLIVWFLLSLSGGGLWAAGTKKSGSGENLYENLDLFSKVLHIIQNDYVEKKPDEKLIEGAIDGMVSTLDPHSAYLSPDLYEELKADTQGQFGGIGIEITVKDQVLTVVSPIEGTPAEKAGIRTGDKIVRINGSPTKGMNIAEAIRKMRGKKGEKISLTLQREGLKDPIEISLHRDTIKLKSVRSELLEPGYGYVRVISFQEGTARELLKNLESVERQNKGPLKGLILDFRNNPGGLLDEAIQVADEFLSEGAIVSTVSREKEIDKKSARRDGSEPHYPMIVMINGGSASASEIVAGALQDHRRAVILGTSSFGKGSVQSVFELGDGAALKLTVARYLTPSGRSIQAEGIEPDVIVEPLETSQAIKFQNKFIREKDLEGHLRGQSELVKAGSTPPEKETADFQKQVALNYLKSWELFSRPPDATQP